MKKQNTLRSSSSSLVILVSCLTLFLYIVPILRPLSYPFLLLSTLVHEMGHGVAALLVGGSFLSFSMWPNGSGVANIAGNLGPFAKAFVAALGLLGPSIVAAAFFMSLKSEKRSRVALALFGIVLLLSLLIVVRNMFGMIFVSIIVFLCYYFSLGGGKNYAKIALSFLSIQLSLSVFSRSDYLFTDKAVTSLGVMPSDVAQIADALILPYWFWGILCGLISLAILALGVRRIFS
jgi:hypothetical protein